MKIVIIEDEAITAKDLCRTISIVRPSAQIVTVLSSIEEADIFLSEASSFDLIFSDIQLTDGLSFAIFKKFSIQAPIIFCTAYDAYWLEAFKVNGIDYILKPFTNETVEAALLKYENLKKQFSNSFDFTKLLAFIEQPTAKRNAVLVRHRDTIIPVSIDQIALFYINENTNYAYGFNGQKHLISENLEQLENELGKSFFRANRQYLINRAAVKNAIHHFNRKLLVELTIPFPEQILVGKLKTTAFTEWLVSI
jgi:two-component system, LytTR family, response regulator LytT